MKISLALLLLLAVLLLPVRYLNDIYGWLPILLAAFLFGLSALTLLLYGRRVKCSSNAENLSCLRGEEVSVRLSIDNQSRFICPKAEAWIWLPGLYGEPDTVSKASFPMAARSSTAFDFDVKMQHVGIHKIGLKRLVVYDLLGLLRRKLLTEQSYEVTVLPRIIDVASLPLSEDMQTEDLNTRLVAINEGYDYSGIREYIPGDPVKKIHWKVSAHAGELITKINESSRRSDLAVILDLTASGQEPELLPDIYDHLVECALSFTDQALRRGLEFTLFFTGQNGFMERTIPKTTGDHAELIRCAPRLFVDVSHDIPDGAALLQAENRLPNQSSNIIICTSNVTEPLLQRLVSIRRDGRMPVLCYILPRGLNSKEKETRGTSLRVLDNYGIPYYMTAAERNVA